MIDFHAHILPGIDDGSRDIEESIALLKEEKAQGVDVVIATPHFYPEEQSIGDFLEKRNRAFRELCGAMPEGLPKILLGAEVFFYEGMIHSADLSKLCMFGTKLFLLEMSWNRWTDRQVQTILSFSSLTGLRVVLAHAERYLPMQTRAVQKAIYDSDVLIQSNASYFWDKKTEKEACKLLKEGKIHFLGSDAHRIDTRPPRISAALEAIADRNGAEAPIDLSKSVISEIARARV